MKINMRLKNHFMYACINYISTYNYTFPLEVFRIHLYFLATKKFRNSEGKYLNKIPIFIYSPVNIYSVYIVCQALDWAHSKPVHE